MKSDCKTACILMDENDLKDFRDSYRDDVSKESLLVPFDDISRLQVMFHESNQASYIPKMVDEGEFSIAKSVYSESQKFLKQLLLANKIVDEAENSFPLEHSWFCFWGTINRAISFCSDFVNKHSVREVILIKRDKFVNHAGLLISTASFTDLIEAFLKSKNIKVKVFKHRDSYVKPRTIFYSQKHNWKSSLKHLIKFIHWKALSFNKKDYSHILIKPGCENVINYQKAFSSSNKLFPQAFQGVRLPFLHSWRKLLRFLVARILFKFKYSDNNSNIIRPYKTNLDNFEFDFAKTFQSTVVRYLIDARWMKNYIDIFWNSCLRKGARCLTIFSVSPLHLHSYFLIKKTKGSGGRIAVWQHGGEYGYMDHLPHHIMDYKNADYFLSFGFGKCDIEEVAKSMESAYPACVEVGSNVFYGRPELVPNNLRVAPPLFVPAVIERFYGRKGIACREDLQVAAIKQIIDFFDLDRGGNIVVKGLKKHLPHQEIQRYVGLKGYKDVSYSDIPIDKALSGNPKFVILDGASTPLLRTLAQYSGMVFLIKIPKVTQKIKEEALVLLKRRVVYSESIDELRMQLNTFLKEGTLAGVNTEDTSFIDVYLKKFQYLDYERFLQEATSTPK